MADDDKPPVFNYILSFILVGIAWGFTTPFIRRAARTHSPPAHPVLDDPAVKRSWLKTKLYSAFFAVIDLLRNPRYAIPLLLNLTGSVWFFLLIGQAGESLLFLSLRQGYVISCGWRQALSAALSDKNTPVLDGADHHFYRAQLDRAHRQYHGVSLHRIGRLVCRGQGYQQRFDIFSCDPLPAKANTFQTRPLAWLSR